MQFLSFVSGSFCKTAPQNYLGFYGYVLGEGLWGGGGGVCMV